MSFFLTKLASFGPFLLIIEVQLVLTLVIFTYATSWGGFRSIDDFEFEAREFIKEYQSTVWWWLTSFVTSVIALTVGAAPGLIVDVLILSVFFVPPIAYFVKKYPFSISCKYRPTNQSGQPDAQKEVDGVAFPDEDGFFEIDLMLVTGSNVSEYQINLETPDGIESMSVQSEFHGPSLKEERIVGPAPPGKDPTVLTLVLQKIPGQSRSQGYLILQDANTQRTLESVRLGSR